MKIREAWEAGFNASRVTVAVVDDGVDVGHVDLRSAFSPHVSFDFVRFGTLPLPKKSKDTQHGTQCAGLVAMEGNQCGLGVGHGATLGAIRLLGQEHLNDALEGDALAFQKNLIDIYSVSWGPKDDGVTAEKPAKFTEEAIRNGAIYGRNGLGNIFVWASGNGGANGDNCALDGYVNNEYTVS
ncbi:hypothetical protein CAEBREN_31806 [Caenorhabditis brenneri]|uniref:Peptidase S8/S53 domain-containing protein n=1 Tax=Caenorhabditis brenneri TaxID=135651 RepID=G0NVC9_CAEBE|nr:hypothetical protein CAEBREN_31806 [Caenorhabditis brenneri]